MLGAGQHVQCTPECLVSLGMFGGPSLVCLVQVSMFSLVPIGVFGAHHVFSALQCVWCPPACSVPAGMFGAGQHAQCPSACSMPISVFGAHWFVWCPLACSVQIGMFCAVGVFGAGLGCVSDSGWRSAETEGWVGKEFGGTRPALPRGLFAHNTRAPHGAQPCTGGPAYCPCVGTVPVLLPPPPSVHL